MRIIVLSTLIGFGLLACHPPIAFLNADELANGPVEPAKSAPCNDVEQQGDEIVLRGSHAPAPTPEGGIIEDGTYVLTSSTLHTKDKSHGATLVGMGKITMRVNGSSSEVVRNTVNGRERRTTVNRSSSGTVTTLQTTCAFPSANDSDPMATASYTATGSSLQFIMKGPAGTVVATYKKLPSSSAVSRADAPKTDTPSSH
jgi:hypothetical protein